MSISDTPLDGDLLSNIRDCAQEAAGLLSISLESPAEFIVEVLDLFAYQWQKGDRPTVPGGMDLSLTLGSLWGEQLVRELGWQWSSVTNSETGTKMVGVVSVDRSLVIYPFHSIYACTQLEAPVNLLLSFNMLKSGSAIPTLPPQSYVNVTDSVRHVVPRG